MSEFRERFHRAVAGEDPESRLDAIIDRAGRREHRRRLTTGVVAFAMFGAVAGGLWLGTQFGERPVGQPAPSGTTDSNGHMTPSLSPSAGPTADPSTSPTVDPSASSLPTPTGPYVARVTCTDDATSARDQSVAALEDGAHFSVENRTDGRIWFQDLGPLEPGTIDEFVLQEQPGKTEVYCSNEAGDFTYADVTIEDPNGYWISTFLDCPGKGPYVMSHSDLGDDIGYTDPIDAARRTIPGVRDDDVVERAGYPESRTSAVIRVVRDGATLATAEFGRAGDAWSFHSYDMCGENSILDGEEQPTEDPQPATVATVICEDGITHLPSVQVEAQPDGVHFMVENRSEVLVLFSDQDALEPGESRDVVLTHLPPGEQRIYCYPESHPKPTAPEYKRISIVDPHGYWASPDLECPPGGFIQSTTIDFADLNGQGAPTPEEAVREYEEFAKRILQSDEVRRAGYPEEVGTARAVVVRDGKTIASVGVQATNGGGWVVSGNELCDGVF